MQTKTKITIMNTVLVVGAVGIIGFVWPQAMKPLNYGGAYAEGPTATIFLALVETGIPTLLWLAFGHFLLAHFMFAEGELNDYKARLRVEAIGKAIGQEARTTETTKKENSQTFDD